MRAARLSSRGLLAGALAFTIWGLFPVYLHPLREVAATQVIAHRMTEVTYVDMRYSNGFAIGWRTQASPASVPAKHSDDTDV